MSEIKIKLTIDECIAFADEWSRGMTIHEGSQGWRIVCMLLADEVRRLSVVETENAVQRLQIDHLKAELVRLREQEPYAYETYKGYLLHAGNPEVSNHSNPKPLYTEPQSAQAIPAELLAWANDFEPIIEMDDENTVSEKITRNVARKFVREQLDKMKGES
jgi:hypothetical protein